MEVFCRTVIAPGTRRSGTAAGNNQSTGVTIANVKRPGPEITCLITSTNQQRQFKILQIYLQIMKKNKIN
jgi:hypothetical protein